MSGESEQKLWSNIEKLGLKDNRLTENGNGSENYIFDIPLDFQANEGGLGIYFFNCMKQHKNSVAQYVTDNGEEDTYGDLLKRCIRTALHLQSRNLTKDDIIVVCSYNQKNTVVPLIACCFLGIPVSCLDPTMSILDMSHLLKETKPKMVFIVPEVIDVIESSLKVAEVEAEVVIYGKSEKYTEFSSFLKPHENEDIFTPKPVTSLNNVALITFSSGTTGLPKGVMLSHYSLLFQGHTTIERSKLGPVTVIYSSFYWISAYVYLVAIVGVGGAKLLCRKFDPQQFWYLLDKYKVTNLFLSSTAALDIVKAGRPDNIDTKHFSHCIIGGAAFPEKKLLELTNLLPSGLILQGYGMTELAGPVTLFNVNSSKDIMWLQKKRRSVGVPIPGIKCKVVEPNTGRICGPNEQGELRIKSRAQMVGYYNRDSSESYDSEGWLRTGDVLYFDEDGCFYVVGRIKELLKYKSLHVPPAVIEGVIMSHPHVAQAVVIGIPDEEDGDLPMALIIRKESGNKNFDVEEIKNYVETRVPDRMKLRGGIKIVNSFPLTPSGKIKRVDLKNMVLRGEI